MMPAIPSSLEEMTSWRLHTACTCLDGLRASHRAIRREQKALLVWGDQGPAVHAAGQQTWDGAQGAEPIAAMTRLPSARLNIGASVVMRWPTTKMSSAPSQAALLSLQDHDGHATARQQSRGDRAQEFRVRGTQPVTFGALERSSPAPGVARRQHPC
jgi:hypothetical protein